MDQPLKNRKFTVNSDTQWVKMVDQLTKLGATIYGKSDGHIDRVWLAGKGWAAITPDEVSRMPRDKTD